MKVLAIFLVLCSCSCLAQVAVDQTATAGSATTGTSLACGSLTVNANTLILVWETVDDDGTTTFSVPTATGLTFVAIGSLTHSAGNYYAQFFRAYSSSSLGATTITAHWSLSADAKVHCFSLTGTAGTSGNNGSDAIGTNSCSTTATLSPSVTVTSSSHNNSKYVGGILFGQTSTATITVGGSYTSVINSGWSTWLNSLTEISTSPVSPAANTAVNGTLSGSVPPGVGVCGVEILVASAAAVNRRRASVITQ